MGVTIDFDDDFNNDFDNSFSWDADKEYIMTPDGLKKVTDLDPVELKSGRFKVVIDADGDKIEAEGEINNNKDEKFHYRYKQIEDSIRDKAEKKMREESRVKDSIEREKKLKEVIKSNAVNAKEQNNNAEEPLSNSSVISPVTIFADMAN